jgi:electron transport complex protein RnfC
MIHASITGRVAAIGPAPVAGRSGDVPCVTIDGDGSDEPWPGYAPRPDALSLPPAELKALIGQSGILGLGGALFPTGEKLAAAGAVPVLLLNGAECEPYISCDDLLLRERAALVVEGGRLLLAALGAELCVIALKTDMPEARLALAEALEAAGDPRLALSVVTAKYPAGGERQLIELALEREVPAAGHPADAGVICQNVATAAAVADFFGTGRPLISRIVTVTGGGVAQPCNIEARLGTPVRQLITLAGGYQDEPRRLIMGGPMMGVALPDDGLPITAATNCLLVATAAELRLAQEAELPCIRCGECMEACPAGLQPQELLFAARQGKVAALVELGVTECIECCACDYICPSRIPLTRQFIAGKALVADAAHARQLAADARARFEARTGRLARGALDAADALARQTPDSGDPAGRAALEALLARTRRPPTGDPG